MPSASQADDRSQPRQDDSARSQAPGAAARRPHHHLWRPVAVGFVSREVRAAPSPGMGADRDDAHRATRSRHPSIAGALVSGGTAVHGRRSHHLYRVWARDAIVLRATRARACVPGHDARRPVGARRPGRGRQPRVGGWIDTLDFCHLPRWDGTAFTGRRPRGRVARRHRIRDRPMGRRRLARRYVHGDGLVFGVGVAAVPTTAVVRQFPSRRFHLRRFLPDTHHRVHVRRAGSGVAVARTVRCPASTSRAHGRSGYGCHGRCRRAVHDQLRHRDWRSALRDQLPHGVLQVRRAAVRSTRR